GVGRGVFEAERAAMQFVEVAPRLDRAPLRADKRGDHLFGGGLAGRAGDGDEGEVVTLADRSRQILEGDGGVADADDAFVRRNVLRNLRDYGAARGGERLRDEL